MESSFKEDVEVLKLIQKARDLFDKGNYIKSLELIEDLILVHREDKNPPFLHVQQGKTFYKLAEKNPECFVYLLASVECFSHYVKLSQACAFIFYKLAKQLGSVLYYKKCVDKAKQAEFKIAASKISPLQICEPKVRESKKCPEPSEDKFKGLRSYWAGLYVKIRRDSMKVSIEKLISFVVGVHKRKGRVALEEVLASAREDRKWTFRMYRTKCSGLMGFPGP